MYMLAIMLLSQAEWLQRCAAAVRAVCVCVLLHARPSFGAEAGLETEFTAANARVHSLADTPQGH